MASNGSRSATAADVDLLILGGGLAGGLVALAVRERRPQLRLMVLEQAPLTSHIWSHFSSDVDDDSAWLVDPLIVQRWPSYDVAFPGFRRTLDTPYRSITSERLLEVMQSRLGPDTLVAGKVVDATPTRVALADGRTIRSRAVLDARGPGDLGQLDLGYQKFYGQVLRVAEPHGLQRPTVMDATVEQIDGYRFVYLLPLSPMDIFVEDTYYSDSAELDLPVLRQRIAEYACDRGWAVQSVGRTESGVLPVVIGGSFERYWNSSGRSLAKAGMRAGLFHPTTGYSLPDAIRLASLIADSTDLSHRALYALTHGHAACTWKARRFYHFLDSMLFGAAEPDERYRVLQRHYQLDSHLVQRFYAAAMTRSDQFRILGGRPPVARAPCREGNHAASPATVGIVATLIG